MTDIGRSARPIIIVAVFLCVSSYATGQSAETSTVELQVGDNMRYIPSVIEVNRGQRLQIVLKRVGKLAALAHNFMLLDKGTAPKEFVDEVSAETEKTGAVPPAMRERVIAMSGLARLGENAEVTFEAPSQPGEYVFVCTFPGHFNLGMKGQLIVK